MQSGTGSPEVDAMSMERCNASKTPACCSRNSACSAAASWGAAMSPVSNVIHSFVAKLSLARHTSALQSHGHNAPTAFEATLKTVGQHNNDQQ